MKDKDLEKNIRSAISPAKEELWSKIEKNVGFSETCQKELVADTGSGTVTVRRNVKKRNLFITFGAIFLAIIIALACILPSVIKKPLALNYEGSLFIDINPSVQIVVDGKGKVTEVVPLNADAVVLFEGVDKSTYAGLSAEEMAVNVWVLAYSAGYISPTAKNNAVLITGSLVDQTLSADWSNKIKEYLVKIIKEKGVFCAVLTEKLDKTLEEKAKSYGVSTSKYQLILTAQSLGVKILESEYATISVTEINQRITAQGKSVQNFGGSDFMAQFERAEDLLDKMEDVLEDNGYERFEESLELLEDILDEIEDFIEDGRSTTELFALLKSSMELLPEIEIIQAEFSEFKEIINSFGTIDESISSAKNDNKNRHDEYVKNAQEKINGHKVSDNFDEEYEEWLEEIYEDYYEHWEENKKSWKSGLGR